jgi:hypothetical protein
MSDSAHDRLIFQLATVLPVKPGAEATQAQKKAFSEKVSQVVALAVAKELRGRGLDGARPTEQGLDDKSGAERRMAGGIGAKKVDVTWSTEESGLLIAFSIKSINFKDSRTKNYQKNLTNRRGDLLFESITLHRRFPYSVLVGLFFFDEEAQRDETGTRRSTFENAHERLLLFKGRIDPAGRDEQYEHLYVGTLGIVTGDAANSCCDFYRVGEPKKKLTLDAVLDESLQTLVIRNADLYALDDEGRVRPAQRQRSSKKTSNNDGELSDEDDE